MEWRGKPKVIRCDNGPEYLSTTIVTWTQKLGTRLEYIEPGKPQQNAYIERFNRTARYEWLSQYLWEGAGSAGSGRLDVDLQSRAPKYGIGRLYPSSGWPWPLSFCRLWKTGHYRPTGAGKTWLACAFGQQACRQGFSVFYVRVARLFEELKIAHGDGSFTRRLAQLAKIDVLILDDWGLQDLEGGAQ